MTKLKAAQGRRSPILLRRTRVRPERLTKMQIQVKPNTLSCGCIFP